MSLINLVLGPPSPVHLLPELRQAILADIKDRYASQIEPSLWKAHFDDADEDQEFLNATSGIVDSVIEEFTETKRLAKLSEKQRQYLSESLWEESQGFWYEHIEQLRLVFSFIEHILGIAQREIEELFPNSERVFGPMTKSLLVDLDFQHEFYRYARVAKPDLIDLRRMINISGQIVESISFAKVFPKEELTLGSILKRLKDYRDSSNRDRRAFFARLPKGNLLQSKEFIGSLSTLLDLRNTYSHGGSSKQATDDDFRRSIIALIDKKIGVLPKLYEALKDVK